jgi:DNA topoisomerase-1
MRTLVITEKFNTALRIAVVLSDGRMQRTRIGATNVFRFERPDGPYAVTGLRGHIVELDYPEELSEWTLAGLPKLLETEPLKRVTETGIVETLKSIVREFDRVIIATDFDREGELIGLECLELLLTVHPTIEVKRAHYSALTRDEIEQSFANLKELDRALADAAASRQEIDLVWGALLTRYLSLTAQQPGRGFLSVGRVQTPTLALLVARDQEIKEFQPTPYWTIEADARGGSPEEAFTIAHEHGTFDVRADAEAAFAKVKDVTTGTVTAYAEEPTTRRPPIPFSTTLFVAEAVRQGLGAANAMRIAEDLYTQGAISYPRTDNTVYPKGVGLRNLAEKFLEGPFKEPAEYVLSQPTFRATRGRMETTDHPPIYPTAAIDPKKLKPDHAKVYELIVRRFLATLAPDSTGLSRTTTVDVGGVPFQGKGQILVELGWYRVYPYSRPEQSPMPVLVPGLKLPLDAVRMREDQTKPPRRYTQGTLIQEMERLGLGTKSTRHDVLQKLFDRHYVDTRSLEPTSTGIAVTEALQANAPVITRPEMTHRLEEEMELVAESKKPKSEVLADSREMLREAFSLLQQNQQRVRETLRGALDKQHFVGPCAVCGGALSLQRSPRGARWVQCANNPASCTASYPLPSAGFIEPAPEYLCGTCKVPRVKIIFRGQRPDFYCINPECVEHHKAFRIGVCPLCSRHLEIRYSFMGKRFVGCSGYPECRQTYPLPQRGKLDKAPEPCPTCKAPIVTAIEAGRRPWTLCINPACPSRVTPERKKPARKVPAKAGARASTGKAAAGKKAPARARAAPRRTPTAPAEPSEAPASPGTPTTP